MERPTPALQKEKITKHRQEIMEQLLQLKNKVSVFGSFLPNLVNYLQMLCHTFQAGQVAAHVIIAWRTLTSDGILLSDVLGAAIECTATHDQHKLPNQSSQNMNIPLFIKKCTGYLKKVSSQRCHLYLSKFFSNVFLRPKWDPSTYTKFQEV